MCRLYAFKSNHPSRLRCSLVQSQNALLAQSRRDSRGESNLDGWGIVFYEEDRPWLQKSGAPAYRDVLFRKTVQKIYARTVVAHIRQATVGKFSINNAHPFVYERWTFAHNGTLYGFRSLEPEMLSELDADLREERRGDTDSELIFLWLLTRMRKLPGAGRQPAPAFPDMMDLLAESLEELDRRSRATREGRDSELNFILTDGRMLFAARYRNGLFIQHQGAARSCDDCGGTHFKGKPPDDLKSVIFASEPVNSRHWDALPHKSVTGLDEKMDLHQRSA